MFIFSMNILISYLSAVEKKKFEVLYLQSDRIAFIFLSQEQNKVDGSLDFFSMR